MTASVHEPPAEALAALPVFPLPGVVLFPGTQLSLHIFEPRYRAMLRDCLRGYGAMAMALSLPGPTAGDPRPPIATIAGAGVIVEHHPLPDGRSGIVLAGRCRVRLDELAVDTPYRQARATRLVDTHDQLADADRAALLSTAHAFAAEVARKNASFSLRLPASLSAAELTDLCAHHLVLASEVRQALLEELDVRERARALIGELATQRAALLSARGAEAN